MNIRTVDSIRVIACHDVVRDSGGIRHLTHVHGFVLFERAHEGDDAWEVYPDNPSMEGKLRRAFPSLIRTLDGRYLFDADDAAHITRLPVLDREDVPSPRT